ncbi:hypothetical protein LK12_19220 [Novosphingobium malaysiense]|uniref:Glycosyl transferase family 1 n=1 Tax=Novosphingobium malaysiense TaxID=1348853 RepID=A0A0B1ZL72_9SPHN|nr:hypothetical protein LK12_19220 [Novosphingobium malaysiense]
MRIIILHNYYQQAGGEDAVVGNEAMMLRNAGHDVEMVTVSNGDINGIGDKLRTAFCVAHSSARYAWMKALLSRFRPDIVHVHNFFPLLTPAVHQAAHEMGVPVVQTLHNFRLFCAKATFERDGRICELCLHGSRVNAVRFGCYRNSRIGSLALVAMQRRAIDRGLLIGNVDLFIALTKFAQKKYYEGGIPLEKIALKPNFVDSPSVTLPEIGKGALYVGRISEEKGVGVLIEAWKSLPDIPLTIAGDGPLRRELEARAPANVNFLGRIDADHVAKEMRNAAILVIPSIWYEGFPMTLVEAFSNGLPVVASRIGSLTEIVEHGVTGAHCLPGNAGSLAETVRQMFERPDALAAMRRSVRRVFEEQYSKEQNLRMIEDIYKTAIKRSRAL